MKQLYFHYLADGCTVEQTTRLVSERFNKEITPKQAEKYIKAYEEMSGEKVER